MIFHVLHVLQSINYHQVCLLLCLVWILCWTKLRGFLCSACSATHFFGSSVSFLCLVWFSVKADDFMVFLFCMFCQKKTLSSLFFCGFCVKPETTWFFMFCIFCKFIFLSNPCDAYIVQIGHQKWVFVNWEEGWMIFHPLTKGYMNLHEDYVIFHSFINRRVMMLLLSLWTIGYV